MRVCLSCATRFVSAAWRCPACAWAPPTLGEWPVFARDLAESNDGFSAGHFRALFEAEANHFWFRSRNRLLIWALRTYFPEAASLLEIGCGTGYVLAGIRDAFPSLNCTGSELFLEGLEFAKTRLPGVDLSQMNASTIPFENEFDVVGAFDVLEHTDDDEGVLAQMFQAATPGGGVVITVPQHPFLWSAVDEQGAHRRRYTRRELVCKLQTAGFQTIRATSFVSLLLPVLILKRTLGVGPRPVDALAELRINATLNALFERTLDIERTVIGCGLSLPAGASLLAIARKRA